MAYQSGDRTGDWPLDPVTTVDAATAEDLFAAIANFNARNDRNGTTPVSPTVATDGDLRRPREQCQRQRRLVV